MARLKYLLDTNICIYIIKNKPSWVTKKFNSHEIGSIGISSITLSELCYGVEKSQQKHQNQRALENFILPLHILPYNEAAAFQYGKIRAYLEKQGKPIGSYDLMIAAHTICLDMILVTNHTKEFERVKNLNIENWAKS